METPLPFMPQVLGELAHAAVLAGDLAIAVPLSEVEPTRQIFVPGPVVPPVGGIGQDMGSSYPRRATTAVALAMELADQAQGHGQITFQIQALHDVARLGEASRVSSALREAAAGVEGRLAPL